MSWFNYDDILKAFEMSYEESIFIREEYFEYCRIISNNISHKFSYTEIKQKRNSYKKYSKLLNDLTTFYFNKIFSEGFSLSVEDISRYLDITVVHVSTSIIPNLRRIELPKLDRVTKKIIKDNLKHSLYYTENPTDIFKEIKSKVPEERFLSLFNKKVLYSADDFFNYVNNNFYFSSNDKITVSVEFTNYELDLMTLKRKDILLSINKFCKSLDIKDDLLLKNFIDLNYIKEKFHANYFKYKNNAADPVLFNSQIKSATSLKVIFNIIYQKSFIEEIERMPFIIPLNIKTHDNKIIKRYLVTEEILIDKFKKGLESTYTPKDEELENDEEIKNHLNPLEFNFKIKRLYFERELNGNTDALKILFLEYFNKNMKK